MNPCQLNPCPNGCSSSRTVFSAAFSARWDEVWICVAQIPFDQYPVAGLPCRTEPGRFGGTTGARVPGGSSHTEPEEVRLEVQGISIPVRIYRFVSLLIVEQSYTCMWVLQMMVSHSLFFPRAYVPRVTQNYPKP